jgi:hypothetical protein
MDRCVPEGKPIIEGKSIPEERMPECEPIPEERMPEGEPIPEERMPEGEPIPEERMPEGEPIPEKRMPEGEPIPEERMPEGKSIAVEREGAGSHEAARKGRPTKAATTKVPPTEATSAVKGGRAQCRAGRDNRRSGQCNHYLVDHDAPPAVGRCTPAFSI